MNYHVLSADPAGNITLFVLDPVPACHRPSLAARLMALPGSTVEQVGFVTFEPGALPHVEMMGDEFCGNAARSFGLLVARRVGQTSGSVAISISGCAHPLEVTVGGLAGTAYVSMPLPVEVGEVAPQGHPSLPVVVFEGLCHAIAEDIPPTASHFEATRAAIEAAYHPDAIGVLYLAGERMTPAVYVAATDTTVWEQSCGSGSVAAALWRNRTAGDGEYRSVLTQPGGSIEVMVTRQHGHPVAVTMGGPVTLGEETLLAL